MSIERHWNFIKRLKAKDRPWRFPENCNRDEGFGFYDVSRVIIPKVNALEEMLKNYSSGIILKNMSNDSLKTAAEMFLYLNSCSYFLKPWLSFYTGLFYKKSEISTAEIILSLNRIMKPWNKPRDIKIASQIFGNLTSLLALNYQNIENIMNGNLDSFLEDQDLLMTGKDKLILMAK